MAEIRALKYTFVVMMGIMIVVIFSLWGAQSTHQMAMVPENIVPLSSAEFVETCYDARVGFHDKLTSKKRPIYFVTPTYPRPEQVAELTRLGQTLMHVENLHWLVADDNAHCSDRLLRLLKKFGLPLTYIASPMPEIYRAKDISNAPRGVANRRAALRWIREYADNGVIYFGDDDNTFDLELFEEIRSTKKVSMLPVGLIASYGVSSPVVKEGKVVGFFDGWPGNRRFAVDMAGFAVSVEFFKRSPDATMPYKVGYEEDNFLKSLGLRMEEIEPLADGCTKILVWHTRSVKNTASTLHLTRELSETSLDQLLNEVYLDGLSLKSRTKGVKTFYVLGRNKTFI